MTCKIQETTKGIFFFFLTRLNQDTTTTTTTKNRLISEDYIIPLKRKKNSLTPRLSQFYLSETEKV